MNKGEDPSPYTSIYLDGPARDKLNQLTSDTGKNKSEMVRTLIRDADGKQYKRIAERDRLLAKLISDLAIALESGIPD